MEKNINSLLIFFFIPLLCLSQGISNNWLIGYQNIPGGIATSGKAVIDFNSGQAVVSPQVRKMRFNGTEANISDNNGNLIISSNGIWVANATGDTMQNGGGLNPAILTTNYNSSGYPVVGANIILPFPGDSMKYILFHQATDTFQLIRPDLYFSLIDMGLDGGLGAIIQKNIKINIPMLGWGLSATKHANGRDWWLVGIQDSSSTLWKFLLTPNGIQTVNYQTFASNLTYLYSYSQTCFSPDGQHFAFTSGRYNYQTQQVTTYLRHFNFDRCTGNLSELTSVLIPDIYTCWGVCYSSNSNYLYLASKQTIYQLNINATNIASSIDTVAVYDGFTSPPGNYSNKFYTMYLADDDKIYISSESSTLSLHYINKPDSSGISCDVRQHSLPIPCYHFVTVPNHPNYFLGADTGSVCDTLLSMKNSEFRIQNEKIAVFPNPAREQFTVYQWQAHENYFVLIDAMGKEVIRKKISGKESIINTDALQQGIYFWSCANQRGKINVLK
ncbi:MAG TPA: T9SS type A sorting domain-containing protein [Bacteroidia bacterium]|nr:T9SS type A sorting domain-containing protein [Bacteroidia bacterium]